MGLCFRIVLAALLLALPGATARAEDGAVLRNVAYGSARLQTMDVYLPAHADHAPVIMMVHGGGWRIGDKTSRGVVENKAARWLPRGFILVSVNYPMLPKNSVAQQADDIARAVAMAQRSAVGWGGDLAKFILMGHSAGAHLVSLLTVDPQRAYRLGARPWLGTVSLDSAAMDVPRLMEKWHPRLYDRAFGDDLAQWKALSPYYAITAQSLPWLNVCSSQRDTSCSQSAALAEKAKALGVRGSVISQDLTHAEINATLGLPGDYTKAVERFMASLDPAVAARLNGD